MKQLRPALLIALLLLLWPSGVGAAAALPRGALADELVIKLRPGAALSSQALARGPHAADLNRSLRGAGTGLARELAPGSNTYRMRVRPGTDLPTLHLPAEAFVRLVYGRLDADHTPHRVQADGLDLDDLRKVFPGP